MPKFRKKPIVIEAWRLPMSDGASRAFDGDPNIIFKRENGAIIEAIISTLEGTMIASNGDWIIRGVKGELYPCKPGIFADTYDYLGTGDGEFERGKDVGRAIGWDAAKRDTSKSLGTDQ